MQTQETNTTSATDVVRLDLEDRPQRMTAADPPLGHGIAGPGRLHDLVQQRCL